MVHVHVARRYTLPILLAMAQMLESGIYDAQLVDIGGQSNLSTTHIIDTTDVAISAPISSAGCYFSSLASLDSSSLVVQPIQSIRSQLVCPLTLLL
jgi:hypothetical protein